MTHSGIFVKMCVLNQQFCREGHESAFLMSSQVMPWATCEQQRRREFSRPLLYLGRLVLGPLYIPKSAHIEVLQSALQNLHIQKVNPPYVRVLHSTNTVFSVHIEKRRKTQISGPAQFAPVQFKGQLYMIGSNMPPKEIRSKSI